MSGSNKLAPSRSGPSAPALSADHLSKHFGAGVAFDDVTFEVGRGEVFGFLGPNGAGKTTTVRSARSSRPPPDRQRSRVSP